MADQRGPRRLSGALSARALSTRAGGDKSFSKEELEARERVRARFEQKNRTEQKKQKLRELQENADREKEELLATVSEPVLSGDSEELVSEEVVEEDDNDPEWEDIVDQSVESEDGSKSGYNTRQLKYFSMEADRYRVSDRAAAKLGNALLKDLGLVEKGSTKDLICPSKIRRERKRWGGKLEQEHQAKTLPQGLYSDGKRVNTLIRDTVVTKVQIPGRRGRGSYKEVSTISNKIEKQEHFVIVSEPGGQYCSHVTPEDGSGASISRELADVVREKSVKLRILGMDGCPVNCGIHNGVFRLLETDLGYPVQHCVCLLHLNELPLRHYFIDVDGTTSGPGSDS